MFPFRQGNSWTKGNAALQLQQRPRIVILRVMDIVPFTQILETSETSIIEPSSLGKMAAISQTIFWKHFREWKVLYFD